MKHVIKSLVLLLLTTPILLMSCSSEQSGYPEPAVTIVNSKTYALSIASDSGVSGTAKIIEYSDAQIAIELDLNNTPMGGLHPAHVHFNTAAETGGIALSLEPVNGNTGKSTTAVVSFDDGSVANFSSLIDFNGYINIHLSAAELGTIVAQGDIGQNELTGQKKSYNLMEKDAEGINGTVEFAQRVNQTTLVTIELSGTPAGGIHPAHIHENDVATSGNIIAGLNAVNGDTGISKTQVASLVGGAAVTYAEFLTSNAYVNVHLSDADLGTIVAQGNIGANEGNGTGGSPESKTYTVTNSGASAYVFNGEGFSNTNNPNLTFKRGGTYTFSLDVAGHPFLINTVEGTGTANIYSVGVTNNGAIEGNLVFTVPSDAPDTLYYNCQFHGSMSGTISITD
jgi:hypothetical protein